MPAVPQVSDPPTIEHRYPPAEAPPRVPVPAYSTSPESPSVFTTAGIVSRDACNGSEHDAKASPVEVDVRETLRTPSPTPSEARVLAEKARMCDFKALLNYKRYMNKRGILTIAVVSIILGFVIAFLVEQNRIETALEPFAEWMRRTPGGWVIPIAVLFVISFPPLFGHEIIAILIGDVWGVGIGFGIVAAGTLLGELGNFYAFKWCCTSRGKRLEETNLKYALYAQVVREGGIRVPTVMRFTFIPGHITTAIFSTCGMTLWVFLVSAVLSLPKQLAVVYIGSARDDTGVGSPGKGRAVKAIVVVIGLATSLFAMHYINRRTDEVKQCVIYSRRKARQNKALAVADPEALSPIYEEEETMSPTAPQLPHSPVGVHDFTNAHLHVRGAHARAPSTSHSTPTGSSTWHTSLQPPPATVAPLC